jgi:hypothetical protein
MVEQVQVLGQEIVQLEHQVEQQEVMVVMDQQLLVVEVQLE